jgi:UDP-GlcNAc:undecaprenyl-phosphate GlcNAc-1-phosphate transferase
VQVLVPLARRIGLVDRTGGHKRHDREVPLVGGIAMFCGFLFAVLTLDVALSGYRALFAGGALLVIVGVLDDFRQVPAGSRLVAQIVAALMMTQWGGLVVSDLGPLFGSGSVALGIWAVPFTVFGVVGVINAVNMMDGLDGLAGSISALVVTLLAYLAMSAGQVGASAILAVLLSVVIAFLGFNLGLPGGRPARIYMGDAGSLFLGFGLAYFLVQLSQEPVKSIQPVTALWLLALPLFEAVTLIIRRLAAGRSPFSADRQHIHHALLVRGMSPAATLLAILAVSGILAVGGTLASVMDVSAAVMFGAFVALFTAYAAMMSFLWGRRVPGKES